MKVVVLAGGMGTRLAEETDVRPKPMVEVGGRPLLWHILKHYAHYGHSESVIALGYRGDVIKRYFHDLATLRGDMRVRLKTGEVSIERTDEDDWTVDMVDTGLSTMTGGRVRRLRPWLEGGPFLLTYGDGVSDVDLHELWRFHERNRRIATLTAVRPPSRFGGLVLDGDVVAEFVEKPQIGDGWINGGFMVLEPAIFDYLADDETSLEVDALERLAREGQVAAFKHERFWQCMDTLRDLRVLERLWRGGTPPWRVWS